MQNWIIEIMDQFGYFSIALLIAIENIFPPIPSEIILTFGGFMTTYTSLRPIGVIIAATAGSWLGALVLYYVGSLLPPEKFEQILSGKVGKVIRIKSEDIYKAADWFQNRGKSTVFFCRCIPVVRSLISIPAGMANMRMGQFCIMTILGSLIWNTVLVYLGVSAGASWEKIIGWTDSITRVTVIVLSVVIFVAAAYLYKRNKDRK